MEKLHFSKIINAPKEKVWDTMLQDATYREWTSAFNPGSYYEGSWDQGSKILFIGPDPENPDNGKAGGMVARIAENRPYEYISIEMLGLYADGIEDTTSEEAKKWTPVFENYTFREVDGGTEVLVDIDVLPEHKEMFEGMWPKALEKLKELCEK